MDNKFTTSYSSSNPDSGLQVFKLSDFATHVETEGVWKSQDRVAVTLHQAPGLHITLMAMHAGTEKPWHKVECPISLQVLSSPQFQSSFVKASLEKRPKDPSRRLVRGSLRIHDILMN